MPGLLDMTFTLVAMLFSGEPTVLPESFQRQDCHRLSSCTRLLIPLFAVIVAYGQTSLRLSHPNSLQQHYNDAQKFQAAGNMEQAALEYKMFLVEALRRVAVSRASVGGPARAVPLLEDATILEPDDFGLRLEYAQACLAAGDLGKAKLLAEKTVEVDPKNAQAYLVLGQVLSKLGEHDAARKQLELAVALDPSFPNGYALATEYLKLKNTDEAAKLFAEMLAEFGDTAEIHFQFGTAYARNGYEEQGISELKKTIAKDSRFPGAHYSLGAAYLLGLGEVASQVKAVSEFREELKIHPNDPLSHWQLGHIALNEHRLREAENELTRAAKLDPQNPDIFLFLGQLYSETNRASDAETALRKSIALSKKDVSRSHYQAHYLLGRLLLQSGRQVEGKQEMGVSDRLLKESVASNQGKPQGMLNRDAVEPTPLENGELREAQESGLPDTETLKQIESVEKQIGPAIADSYNNLGAVAANHNDFTIALQYFRKAADWNPALEGLDYNWGKAAFQAEQYQHAVAPLQRHLTAHPDDAWIRAALGTSFFLLKDYDGAVQTFQPIETQISSIPRLSLTYAESLVKTGDFTRGVDWLKKLEKTNPSVADIHRTLGEAFAGQKDYREAAEELRTAVKLNPSDTEAKYHLAVALIESKHEDEAEALLVETVKEGSQDSDVYYQLGKLQLYRGDIKSAVVSLEAGIKIDPGNRSMHYELAAAYRQASRTEDAEREMKLYEASRNAHPGTAKPAQPN
jgi:tetratricopeptide (TPR) repeat protein